MPFKPDFLWGASTSAYQVEGASAEDGKGPSVQDIKTLPPGTADFTVASDHYHRFREDIALMAEMGLKAYRFSIAWTRIYPQGDGPVNVRGLQHYSEVIDTCLAHGLTPIVTMYHFDLPAALDAVRIPHGEVAIYTSPRRSCSMHAHCSNSSGIGSNTG